MTANITTTNLQICNVHSCETTQTESRADPCNLESHGGGGRTKIEMPSLQATGDEAIFFSASVRCGLVWNWHVRWGCLTGRGTE